MKNISTAFLFLILHTIATGQISDTLKNRSAKFKFGLLIGGISEVQGKYDGILAGGLVEFRLTEKICFQPQFMFSFITLKNGALSTIEEWSIIELPMHFMFKPLAWKISPVISLGPDYIVDYTPEKSGWFGNIGLGLEIDLINFLFTLNLRFSSGKEKFTSLILTFKG